MDVKREIKVNDVVRYIGVSRRFELPREVTGEVVRAFPEFANTDDPRTHLVWFDGFGMEDLADLWFDPAELELVVTK